MQSSSFHSFPPLFLMLALLFVGVVAILQIGILGYAYERMGIERRTAYLILLLSLLGSYVNIPIVKLSDRDIMVPGGVMVDRFGYPHDTAPQVERVKGTELALNVGGAIVPTVLSIYLIVKHQIYLSAFTGIALVGAVVHYLAEPIEGMGIAVPVFVPPIVSAFVAMFLSREYAAPLAYVSGCMGTLVGADVLNLHVLGELGASVASIGGAGTFDGVFLTGILAVLLAAGPPRRPVSPAEDPPPAPP
ncbi:MAG: DUF1614 domain-containing protein [Planctomycetota bacterium]|nr:MAG: DUF1614 domain-containing protein [Planctomycetota bacterium]